MGSAGNGGLSADYRTSGKMVATLDSPRFVSSLHVVSLNFKRNEGFFRPITSSWSSHD